MRLGRKRLNVEAEEGSIYKAFDSFYKGRKFFKFKREIVQIETEIFPFLFAIDINVAL